MTDQTFPPNTLSPAERPAHRVTFEDYMRLYAENFAEWVEGEVIPLSPVTEIHDRLFRFLIRLLETYLEETQSGVLRVAPFVMRITPDAHAREPDLHIVLQEHTGLLQPTLTAGAADVVIEIVSKESQLRDLVEKYEEYEAGGVREYWLINPLRRQVDFYVRGKDGLYTRRDPQNGIFTSSVLARFRLETHLFWGTPPSGREIVALVDAMLKE
jgi:Uma2 family endonuclease